jgi:hypothetical protein
LDFGPFGPAPPVQPRYAPQAPRSAHSAQATLAYLPKGVFSSNLRTPVETPSLSHVTAMWGPPVSSIPFPTSADRCHFSSSPLATPRHLAPSSDAAQAITHPAIIPPLICLLTSPSSSMALKPLKSPLLSPATPLRCSPGPYKRAMRPPARTAPHPLSLELLHALLRPRDELKLPPFTTSGALPCCHSNVTGEHLPSTALTGLSSPSNTGEHRRAPAPVRRASVRRCRAFCPRSTAPWTRSMEFSIEN